MLFYVQYAFILLLIPEYIAQDTEKQGTSKSKKDATEEILNKISKISVQTLSKAPKENKLEILKEVQEKLFKAAKSLGKKGERYVRLIMKGIKQKALENLNNNSIKNTQTDIPVNIDKLNNSNTKSVSKEIIKGELEVNDSVAINTSKIIIPIKLNNDTENILENNHIFENNVKESETYNEDDHDHSDTVFKNHLKRTNVVVNENNEIYKRVRNLTLVTSTERLIQILTPRYECVHVLDRTCKNVKQMNRLKCYFGDTEIAIEKLCDGFVDCPDRTDEKFCTSQITERVRNANSVISEAEDCYALGCFPNNTKKSVMTTEIIIFRSILQAQQEFVEKYKHLNWSLIPNSDSSKREGSVKKAVNEISLVISSLALALHAVLCSQRDTLLNTRKFNDFIDFGLDEEMKEVEWPPKSCACRRGRCTNNTCTDSCKRVCWQKFNLARWGCESINETESVSMSIICDGKFDCLDQTDEKDCITATSFAKFEAHEIFREILLSLSRKITSKEYSFIRNMLLSLHNSIENLQKLCMAPEPDIKRIRKLRNECFTSLSSIYSEAITKSSFLYETEEVYLFLSSLNERIVSALKRSNTGNPRIIGNDGCFCKNKRCSMPICTRKCTRVCIIEPILTRYSCEGSFNKSVSIDEICDGKPKCPQEDDEAHCRKDVCRRQHLSLLRHNLQTIGKKREGTSMGELLGNWKLKVSSTLTVAENNGRPTPKIIKDVVKDILNDLVITYGAVEDYRRNNEYALEEFKNIARYIMNAIRSCGY